MEHKIIVKNIFFKVSQFVPSVMTSMWCFHTGMWLAIFFAVICILNINANIRSCLVLCKSLCIASLVSESILNSIKYIFVWSQMFLLSTLYYFSFTWYMITNPASLSLLSRWVQTEWHIMKHHMVICSEYFLLFFHYWSFSCAVRMWGKKSYCDDNLYFSN